MTDAYEELARKADAAAKNKAPTDPNLGKQIRALRPNESALKE
jgi:hypothetical protein